MTTVKNVRRTLVSSGVAALALVLAACANNPADDAGAPEDQSAMQTDVDQTTGPTTESDADGNHDPEEDASGGDNVERATSAAADLPTLLSAISTAEAQLDGSAAFELDRQDDGTYEIDVTDNARHMELRVSADGSAVDDILDDDTIENDTREKLERAEVTMAQALETAFASDGGTVGTVDSVDLEEDDGLLYWDIDMDDDAGPADDLAVDASTGELIIR